VEELMCRLLAFLWASGLVPLCFTAAKAGAFPPAERPLVMQVRLDNQAISPVTARFLHRAIQQAEEQRAACLLIVLDTPGGLAFF
jgi:membrane-bound ClpP family serine protease